MGCEHCLFSSPSRKGPVVLHFGMQWFLPRYAKTDGTHEASSQTQHFLPVSSWFSLFLHSHVDRSMQRIASSLPQRCESCRTKLRSYRGLLTHLHTCSKVSRGRPRTADPGPPPPNAAVTDLDEKPPLLDRLSTPQLPPSEIPTTEGSFLAAVLEAEPPPPLHGTSSPLLAPPQLKEAASQPWVKSEPSDFLLPSNPDGHDRSGECSGLPPDTNQVS